MDSIQAQGRLYAIDLRIFEEFPPATVDNLPRFTPGTVTLLEQDAAKKTLAPLAVRVSAQGTAVVYSPGASSAAPGSMRCRLQRRR